MHKITDSCAYEKSELRKKYLNLRQNINTDDKKIKDVSIKNNVLNLSEIKNAECILIYLSINNEVDTIGLITELLGANKRIAAPVCDKKENIMTFYFFDGLRELKVGRFGILEPRVDSKNYVPLEKVDICICPGLCFDKNGYRLGYGKGFYDRYIGYAGILKIGLCYSDYLIPDIPHDTFDIPMDLVITDKQTVICK